MGGACSVGGRISSEELDEIQSVHLKKPHNTSTSTSTTTDNDNAVVSMNSNKMRRMKSFGNFNNKKKKKNEKRGVDEIPSASPLRFFSGELRFSPTPKVAPRGSSFIGRASEKAVDVIDALGSGMANFNSSGFLSSKLPKSTKISILAFEVANTITRAHNLMLSLSSHNVLFLKDKVIPSLGVHFLVSSDTYVLLSFVAADKREELDVFCKEVTRFGNHCKDPQWHNLDRFFEKLDSESAAYKQEREQAEGKMIELMALAEHTAELYHELNAFDRFEQDYRQKVEEMKSLNLPRKGEHLMMLNDELRQQKKIVMSLKKKCLWSRKLEEVIEKLVDIVAFIRQEIAEVFGTVRAAADGEAGINSQKLGPAGLALHYANVINQMDNIASRPTSLPPTIRDSLYRGLPASVKDALRSKLKKLSSDEEIDVPQIKAQMEKILEWLSPMAINTLKAHQGFGWVGEWANASTEFNKKTAGNGNTTRLQTLYHANKEKADSYILTLVTLLHRLISGIKRTEQRENGVKSMSFESPNKQMLILNSPLKIYPSLYDGKKTFRVELSEEDRKMLQRMSKSRSGPGMSKSQELAKTGRKGAKSSSTKSRSMESSPHRDHLPDTVEGSDLEFVSRGIEAPF